MEYKNKKSYRFGRFLAGVSLAFMTVTFILMGFGKDAAIIWFFLGCLFLVAGGFIMTSSKLKYETTCEGEPSLFKKIQFWFLDVTKAFAKRGKLRAFLLIVLVILTVFSGISIIKTFNVYYDRGGAYNIGYKQNLKKAEEFEALALEAETSGEKTYANYCSVMAEKHREDSEAYLNLSEQLTEKLHVKKSQTVKTVVVNLAFSLIYSGYVIYTKKRTKSKGALSE